METLCLVILIYVTCRNVGTVTGIYITTMLPLPKDLKLLIDSMYDDGYTADYLIKYSDPSKEDGSQSDFMIGLRNQNKNLPTDYYGAVVDPDRDGVRNIPLWMNFTKAVFVPNEIDYKIRARHKFHPHSGRIGGTLQKQFDRFKGDEVELNFGPNENQVATVKSNSSKNTSNIHEAFDFLIPIPEYKGSSTFPPPNKTPILNLHKSIKNECLLPSTTKNVVVPTNKISQTNVQQNFKNYLILPSSDSYQTQSLSKPGGIIVTPQLLQTNSSSGFSWVELFKKTFKYKEKDNAINLIKNYDNEKSLDKLQLKLLNMRNLDHYPKITEERKYLSSANRINTEDIKQTKRLKQLRPPIIRSKIMHPGHGATYVNHFRPFNFLPISNDNKKINNLI